jgi:uncharacterized membrane protein YesL
MKASISVVLRALTELWENAFLSVFCSLVWLFLTLLIIPGPPATVAIYDLARRIVAHDPMIEFGDYLKAVKKNFVLGWRWVAINLPVLIVLLVDIRVIPSLFSPSLAVPVQTFTYLMLAIWLVLNWLALAFLFQQKEVRLVQALRNAGVLSLSHPFSTLMVVCITSLLLWLSLLLVIVSLLFAPMFMGLVATIVVEDKLAVFRAARKANLEIR